MRKMKFKAIDLWHDDESREMLAMFLQATIDANTSVNLSHGFKPYRTDKFSSARWKIDQGNNWFLHFFDDQPDVFEIVYRYQSDNNKAEEALAGWLVYRLGVEIVDEQ